MINSSCTLPRMHQRSSRSVINAIVNLLLAWLLVACGGGNQAGDQTGVAPANAGPTQSLLANDGAAVWLTPVDGVPAQALRITRGAASAPALPAGMQAAGEAYEFGPPDQVASGIEIRVPFDGATSSAKPRLLVALAGDDAWSEVQAEVEGNTLRAQVPALGLARAVRDGESGKAERLAAASETPLPYLRGRLSAQPSLQGEGLLRTASVASTLSIQLDYSFSASCQSPLQLLVKALHVRPATATQAFSVRGVDIGTRVVSAASGSESFQLPLNSTSNGTWAFLASLRCVKSGRTSFGPLAQLPLLRVNIADAPPPAEGSATLGAAGGFVNGPDGVRLAVPPGTLTSEITFRIARDGRGAPTLPAGIELASAVYEVTPHGQVFDGSAAITLPVSATLATGRPTFLMKADPGGDWSIVAQGEPGDMQLRGGIDSLSYMAVGVCEDFLTSPPSIFDSACPSAHKLTLELLINGTTPVPIPQDTTYGTPIPVLLVTTRETLTFRMTWTRPSGTNRVDTLSANNTGNSRLPGFTYGPTTPNAMAVNENNFIRTFTVDVDPTGVAGASAPNGVVSRIWASARFEINEPLARANWVHWAWVPIRVRSLVELPIIDTQPASLSVQPGQSANFAVAASLRSGGILSYRWSRRSVGAPDFTEIAGATAASYTITSAQLADDGAQLRVQVCSAPALCVNSNVATLTVVPASVAAAFTTQPSSQSIVGGQTVSFTSTATGQPLPQVHWQTAPAGSTAFVDVLGVAACGVTSPSSNSGATDVTATCTVGPLSAADAGRSYRAVATNAAGVVASIAAVVTVNPAAVAPTITRGLAFHNTTVGGSATFDVQATGTAPLLYTWRVAGSNLPSTGGSFSTGACTGNAVYGNGGQSLVLSNLSAGCNGVTIDVIVSNGVNPPASSAATLSVTAAPPVGTWVAQVSPTRQRLNAVSAVDVSTAWAIGADGELLRTGNGGTTWLMQSNPSPDNYFGIDAVDAQTAWAVGLNSIVSTVDGGATWTAQPVAAGAPLFGISAASRNVAWAVGQFGVILKTTDGGLNWRTQVSPSSSNLDTLNSVVAVDANTAWALASRHVMRTTDGGATWVRLSTGVTSLNHIGITAASASHAWLVVSGQGILRTVDGGNSWGPADLPDSIAGNEVRLSAVDANTVWAFKSEFSSSTAYRSLAGGAPGSWTPEPLPDRGWLYAISAVNRDIVWIVGDGGRILKR